MAQLIETIEASTEPRPTPPSCTYPDKLWCGHRALRYGKLVCYAGQQCSQQRSSTPQRARVLPRVHTHRAWTPEDLERLQKNKHLDIKVLQWLLEDYSEDEIQDKLEDLTIFTGFTSFTGLTILDHSEK